MTPDQEKKGKKEEKNNQTNITPDQISRVLIYC